MERSFKILLILLVGLIMLQTSGLTANNPEVILFSQVTPGGETLYMTDGDGNNLKPIVSGKELLVFPEKRHLLYAINGKLYEYDFKINQTKLWAQFIEPALQVSVLSDGPDQALIAGSTEYETHYYVLDFSDGDLRRVSAPTGFKGGGNSSKLAVASPDSSFIAIVHSGNGFRYELSVETGNKLKWELPRNLSVFPGLPLWSPDSRKLAFYTMPSDESEGFYSLYLLDLTKPEIVLRKVQDEVFSTYLFGNFRSGGFRPVWSDDSNKLIFSYLPYGLPSESSIISYHVETGMKEILHNNMSQNLFPQLSEDQGRLLFLSDRENNQFRVFLANLKLKDIKKIAPSEGYTAWAEWYTPGK